MRRHVAGKLALGDEIRDDRFSTDGVSSGKPGATKRRPVAGTTR